MNTGDTKGNRRGFDFGLSGEDSGFTRTDLVAVIGMLAILAITLLPALASDRSSSQAFQCMNNLRRLMAAWQMYSTDNSDKLVQTGGQAVLVSDPNDPNAQPGGSRSNWVLGNADATDLDFIRNGLLFPYVNSTGVYKCPADGTSHMRSVSMNAWMNPINTEGLLSSFYIIFREQTDITKPSRTWVLIDENPNSINDGWFVVRPNVPNAWYNLPAIYHRGAAVISFADTHIEVKKWSDRSLLHQYASPGTARRDLLSDDLPWLLERTTYQP